MSAGRKHVRKTRTNSLSRKPTLLGSDYILHKFSITRTDSIRDMKELNDFKLIFHHYVNYIFSQTAGLFRLIRAATISLFPLQRLLVLICTTIRCKLSRASAVLNSITYTDANNVQTSSGCFPIHMFQSFALSFRKRSAFEC